MEELTMARNTPQRSGRWFTWLNWWTCLCLPAFGFAFITWGALATLYVSLAVAFLATLVLIGVRGERSTQPEEPDRTKTLRIIRIDAFAIVALFALMMLAKVSGAFWLLLLSLMIATSPPAGAWWRRAAAFLSKQSREEAQEETDSNEGAPPAVEQPLKELTDIELCYQWRHSFWDLESARTASERANIVMQRQRILDELTARNEPAVSAWLASGARASSSPERFFTDGDSGRPAAA